MGADFYTLLYLGVQLSEDDLVDLSEDVTEEVICSCPEAEGMNFCPRCGTRSDQRTRQIKTTVRTWKPSVAGLLDSSTLASDPGLDSVQSSPSFYVIHQTAANDSPVIYGRQLCDISAYPSNKYDKGTYVIPMVDFETLAFAIRKSLTDNGLGHLALKLQIWTVLYCSV